MIKKYLKQYIKRGKRKKEGGANLNENFFCPDLL